jgi:DNA polymerase III epsilon subunit-like protein
MASNKQIRQFRSCVLDLECTNLSADFGVILCGVIKPDQGDPIILRADQLNKNWKSKRSDDSAVCKAIDEALSVYDIIIAHNGSWYDVPFLRSRLAHWGLPPFRTNFTLIDPLQLARNKLRQRFNGLEALAGFLRVEHKKTSVEGETWLKASLDGDKQAMDYIVEHCVADVYVLEEVFDKLRPYVTQLNSRGSGG